MRSHGSSDLDNIKRLPSSVWPLSSLGVVLLDQDGAAGLGAQGGWADRFSASMRVPLLLLSLCLLLQQTKPKHHLWMWIHFLSKSEQKRSFAKEIKPDLRFAGNDRYADPATAVVLKQLKQNVNRIGAQVQKIDKFSVSKPAGSFSVCCHCHPDLLKQKSTHCDETNSRMRENQTALALHTEWQTWRGSGVAGAPARVLLLDHPLGLLQLGRDSVVSPPEVLHVGHHQLHSAAHSGLLSTHSNPQECLNLFCSLY